MCDMSDDVDGDSDLVGVMMVVTTTNFSRLGAVQGSIEPAAAGPRFVRGSRGGGASARVPQQGCA